MINQHGFPIHCPFGVAKKNPKQMGSSYPMKGGTMGLIMVEKSHPNGQSPWDFGAQETMGFQCDRNQVFSVQGKALKKYGLLGASHWQNQQKSKNSRRGDRKRRNWCDSHSMNLNNSLGWISSAHLGPDHGTCEVHHLFAGSFLELDPLILQPGAVTQKSDDFLWLTLWLCKSSNTWVVQWFWIQTREVTFRSTGETPKYFDKRVFLDVDCTGKKFPIVAQAQANHSTARSFPRYWPQLRHPQLQFCGISTTVEAEKSWSDFYLGWNTKIIQK